MNTIWIVMPILIVLMFLLGIDLNREAFANVARQPKAVLLGLVGQVILLPLIAFSVAWLLKLPPVYFMGLVLVACCPGGSSSNVFSMLAKGDVALSVTLTAASSIITLFTLPVIMAFVAEFVSSSNGCDIHLPIGKLFMQNIVLLFVPLLAGSIFRRIRPNAARKVAKVLGKLAFPALMTLATVFFLQYWREIVDNFTILGLSGALLILLAMLCSGGLSRIGGSSAAIRRTIVIEVGMQNAAQAIAIASSPFIFNSGEMALPAIIYALLMNIILLIYVYCIRQKEEHKPNTPQR
ncbi:MAG: bile acid:sodium symporter family protein [Bacteroidaceae bacterium]|nr:bile acid:sodium symporter family protein [Bacteroidaceae bacterium]